MREILTDGFEELGLRLPVGAAERFDAYYKLLSERSRVMNLTAISGREDTARLHFLDCAAIANAAQLEGKRVIDVGSGAGFPGLPLKIIMPDIGLTLLDSQKKRVDFLSELCEKLGLADVECLWSRAEEAPARLCESFDVATSRAVARLNVLAELCLPFVRPGGVFLAMKGPEPEEEAAEARGAFEKLGGALRGIDSYTIPGTDVAHSVVVVEKTGVTPAIYPRRFAKIQKAPL